MFAAPRFTGFTPVGTITVGPSSSQVVVGAFPLAEGATTCWVNVKQLSPTTNNNFSYGILSWRSEEGRTLGSTKVYGRPEGEVFRLSVGLSPLQRTGSLVFEPRLYNLKWAREGGPDWSLSFSAHSGTESTPGGDGELGAVLSGLADLSGDSLCFAELPDGTLTIKPGAC